jgi:glycosyltransferase involved in cell wall biosynthesis
MNISVIATVKNERETISTWFDSILMQDMPGVEYVIVDGGSTDGTWEWLEEKAKTCRELFVVRSIGNRSNGRNEAIKRTTGSIIVAADAGCRYESGWLKALIEPFQTSSAEVVAGAFGPWFFGEDTLVHYLIAAATTPSPHEFQKNWLPSSRSVAFTRERFNEVGGYPEWLPICEDLVFDIALQKTGAVFAYSRTPLVFWRPQRTVKKYLKQLFLYTRGDGHANLWPWRQSIRYGVYGGSIILLALVLSGVYWLLPLFVIGLVGYMRKFWQRFSLFARPLSRGKRFLGFLSVPVVVALGDVAKMAGYIVGVWQRCMKRIPV